MTVRWDAPDCRASTRSISYLFDSLIPGSVQYSSQIPMPCPSPTAPRWPRPHQPCAGDTKKKHERLARATRRDCASHVHYHTHSTHAQCPRSPRSHKYAARQPPMQPPVYTVLSMSMRRRRLCPSDPRRAASSPSLFCLQPSSIVHAAVAPPKSELGLRRKRWRAARGGVPDFGKSLGNFTACVASSHFRSQKKIPIWPNWCH